MLKTASFKHGERSLFRETGRERSNARLIVFRDLVNGEYTTELTLTSGAIAPLTFPDLQILISQLVVFQTCCFCLGNPRNTGYLDGVPTLLEHYLEHYPLV